MHPKNNKKILLVYGCFLFGALIIAIQAFKIQVIGNQRLDSKISAQLTSRKVFQPKRARIVDRNGKILAYSKQVFSLYVDPSLIQNKYGVAKKISTKLSMN